MNVDENNNKNVNKNEIKHSEKETEIILEDYINNMVPLQKISVKDIIK